MTPGCEEKVTGVPVGVSCSAPVEVNVTLDEPFVILALVLDTTAEAVVLVTPV